ncbi:MAG: hypothetical protein COB37_02325 [Kordiimonadales bacterium]|nr:MAG: hypothetical protein COB37_02325 [Kordiimonadales bacterium]
MNTLLIAASVTGFVTFAVHTWVGTPRVAWPIMATDLAEPVKCINFGSWHGMTACLFFMASAFAIASIYPEAIELAWFAFLYNVSMLILSVVLVIKLKQSFKRIIHWMMFSTTSLLAGFGLLAG